MAADVHVWMGWLSAAAAGAAQLRVLLPFTLVLLCLLLLWLPRLLVGLLGRLSRKYVNQTSRGPASFVANATGEAGDRGSFTADVCHRVQRADVGGCVGQQAG